MTSDHQKGKLSEERAWKYFENKGYQLIDRNVQLYGVEVDLILEKNNTLYIVEVKTNNLWRLECPLSSIQRNRLKEVALTLSNSRQCAVRLFLAVVSRNKQVQIFSLDDSYLDEDLQTDFSSF